MHRELEPNGKRTCTSSCVFGPALHVQSATHFRANLRLIENKTEKKRSQ
jgi:hypothetical protein